MLPCFASQVTGIILIKYWYYYMINAAHIISISLIHTHTLGKKYFILNNSITRLNVNWKEKLYNFSHYIHWLYLFMVIWLAINKHNVHHSFCSVLMMPHHRFRETCDFCISFYLLTAHLFITKQTMWIYM